MITQPPGRSKLGRKHIIGLIITIAAILTVISIACVGFGLSIRSYRVAGISMEPGLHNDQIIFASSLSYKISSPSRGDLVIFHQPPSTMNACQMLSHPGDIILKRIIGIPGDTISITSTSVILNGEALNEPYIAPVAIGGSENGITIPNITLGLDQYFLLGDNRPYSADSRCYGPVPFQDFVGKVLIT